MKLPSLLPEGSTGKDLSSLLSGLKSSASTTVIAEGIPPIATKLLEKIQRWEYVDLSDLLSEASSKVDDMPTYTTQNQVILVQSVDQIKRKKKQILDIETWLQAFSIYAAALTAHSSTSKEESTGLLAHMYLVTQISRDLRGSQWYRYDKEFREWAAAKNLRVWGTLNLAIYGRCLSMPSFIASSAYDHPLPKQKQDRRGKPGKQKKKACWRYNFEVSCGRSESECFYKHSC